MPIVDFYYNKLQIAKKNYYHNHTEANRIAFENAIKNYETVIAGRETLI